MTITTHLLTSEELWRNPPKGRWELVRGELRTMAPAGFDHGAVIDNLQFALSRHVRENKLGVVLGAETGFKLAQDPDTLRGADVSFVKASRIPASGRPAGFWSGAPDLAVEVISPFDTYSEVDEKVADYLDAGTPLVWVVNPRQRTVTIHRPAAVPRILGDRDTLEGEDIIPGFKLPVADIFA